jgi:hypothetical protein
MIGSGISRILESAEPKRKRIVVLAICGHYLSKDRNPNVISAVVKCKQRGEN